MRAEIIDHVRTDTFITTDYTAAELPLVIEESKTEAVDTSDSFYRNTGIVTEPEPDQASSVNTTALIEDLNPQPTEGHQLSQRQLVQKQKPKIAPPKPLQLTQMEQRALERKQKRDALQKQYADKKLQEQQA